MKQTNRVLAQWSRLAVVGVALSASASLAQIGYGNQISGLGTNTPPKVMIIFDTSNSMRHLPSFDPTSGASPPPLPGRGYGYFDDDFSTSPSWDGGCDNRFCIAKRVLHGMIPSYQDSVEIGIAGYYQYRTRWTPPGGATQCVYDVLAGSGLTQTFTSTDPSYSGATAVPPNLAAICDPALHTYPITVQSTNPGAPVGCTNYKDIGASGPYGAGGQPLEGKPGCTDNVIYTRGAPTNLYSGGVDPTTSPLYVRMPMGAATCPAAGQTFFYYRNGGNDMFAAGSWTPGVVGGSGTKLFTNTLSTSAYGAGGAYSWLSNCSNTPSSARNCQLTFSGVAPTIGTETSTAWVWADAGASFDYMGTTYTYTSSPAPQNYTLRRAQLADGGCDYPDTSPATAGTDVLVSNLGGFTNTPGGVNCTNPGPGCRVKYTGVVPTVQNGVWTYTATEPQYTWALPASVTGTCSVSGATQSLSWTSTLTRATFTVSGSTCPDQTGVTNAASLPSSGGVAWSNGTPSCSAGTPCDFQNGHYSTTNDSTTYYSPIPTGSLAGRTLRAGYPTTVTNAITYQLTAYGQTCPGGGTFGSSYTFTNGQANSNCTSPTGCAARFNSFDPNSGAGPADQYWYSNAIPAYMSGGGTFTVGSAVSTITVPKNVYYPPKPAGGCPATFTLTGGESLAGATGSCSATRPCVLNNPTEECYDFDNPSVQVTCDDGSDAAPRRFCRYQATRYSYTAARYGVCKYDADQYRYETRTCRYDVHMWNVNTSPVCQVPIPGVCEYRLTRYTYEYLDPYPYCQVYGTSWDYTGSTGASYVYQYTTKGGEFLGTVTMPSSIGNLNTRNWCELSPPNYAGFSSSCPTEINAGNRASFSSAGTLYRACGTGGRICRLRWRQNTTAADGGVFPAGRSSYYLGGMPDYEVYNSSLARCLAPDRASGETTTPDSESLLSGDTTGYYGRSDANINRTSNGTSNSSTFTGVTAGTYTVTVAARQAAAGSEDAHMRVRLQNTSSGTYYLDQYVYVPNTSFQNYTFSVNIPVAGSYRVRIGFDNDYYSPPLDRNLYTDFIILEKQPDNWCVGTGANGTTQVRLRSDWYDPSATNSMASTPYVDAWTNQADKVSGWSRNSAGDPADIFQGVSLGATAGAAVQSALDKCQRPTDLTTPAAGGLCWADRNTCGASSTEGCQPASAGMSDFTPLYGSLRNAKDFMENELTNDGAGDYECRDYFVLLVTDGLESTPKGYNQTDLQSVVTQLRSLSASGRNKDVKTFVVGFGAGLGGDAGVSDLDVIARTGGTAVLVDASGNLVFDNTNGRAMSATSGGELANVLNIVFSNITAGRYARSRPTATSDGNRIYQAFFERGASAGLDAGSPEWRGDMQAYQLDSFGNMTLKWSLRDKLDQQGSRTLKAMWSDGGSGLSLIDLSTSNSTLTDYVGGGDTDAGRQAIRFARNDTLGAHAYETYQPIATPRRTRLGAFVFSKPVLVQKPPFSTTYGGEASEGSRATYETFRTNNLDRQARILIGSNDGFLRAVKDLSDAGVCASDETDMACSNGTEAWGVVPRNLLRRLPDTRQGARPMVDGTTAVADVCWPSSGSDAKDCTASDWRTLAVVTEREGGKTVYGMDITDPNDPKLLWEFSHSDLGRTWSTPLIGRAKVAGKQRWLVFMGGGRRDGSDEGDSVYVLDAKTGRASLGAGGDFDTDFVEPPDGESLIAPTALYKRTLTVNVESAYYATDWGRIWGQRIDDDATKPHEEWEPKVWYDGWDDKSKKDVFGNDRAPIYYMDKTSGAKVDTGCQLELGHGGTPNNAALPPLAQMTNCSDLSPRRPIFNRPRIANVWDTSLERPDLFFGTGDSLNLGDPNERNFFFAVHDTEFAKSHKKKDKLEWGGRTMWVYMFDKGEKILGEPAFVGGSVVVATYAPPVGGLCQNFGDSYLYAFDPRTGEPRNVLLDPTVATPTFKSVVKLTNTGALSDLMVINGSVYFSTGKGGVSRVDARAVGVGGRVQGWRRMR